MREVLEILGGSTAIHRDRAHHLADPSPHQRSVFNAVAAKQIRLSS